MAKSRPPSSLAEGLSSGAPSFTEQTGAEHTLQKLPMQGELGHVLESREAPPLLDFRSNLFAMIEEPFANSPSEHGWVML